MTVGFYIFRQDVVQLFGILCEYPVSKPISFQNTARILRFIGIYFINTRHLAKDGEIAGPGGWFQVNVVLLEISYPVCRIGKRGRGRELLKCVSLFLSGCLGWDLLLQLLEGLDIFLGLIRRYSCRIELT